MPNIQKWYFLINGMVCSWIGILWIDLFVHANHCFHQSNEFHIIDILSICIFSCLLYLIALQKKFIQNVAPITIKKKTKVSAVAKITANPVACELCELLVQIVDSYLGQNASADTINQTVYDLCNDLPDPIKTTVSRKLGNLFSHFQSFFNLLKFYTVLRLYMPFLFLWSF